MGIYRVFAATMMLAVCTTATGQAAAAEWWYVTESVNNILQFVDAETMVREGQTVRYWQYAINPVTPDGEKSVKYRSETNCSNRKYRTITSVTYSHDDKATTLSGGGSFTDIAPDTIGETILKFVCFPKPAKSDQFLRLTISPEDFSVKWRAFENGDVVPPK